MEGLRAEIIAQRHGLTLVDRFMNGEDVEVRHYRLGDKDLFIRNYHQSPRSISHNYAGTDSSWVLLSDTYIVSCGHEEYHLNHVLTY